MKLCIVCSGNFEGGISDLAKYKSFVYDQANALFENKVEVDYFLIKGKGIKGYLSNRKRFKNFLNKNEFDIIHVHYGLSALFVSLSTQRKFVVTFHGSDINRKIGRILSVYPMLKSSWNIFVSEKLYLKSLIKNKKKCSVIPCGVDTNLFKPLDKLESRIKVGLNKNSKT